MSNTMWTLFRALAGREAGCSCRRCTESILRDDPFGRSEGVCRPCRRVAA
jgi:hypothetical protein